MWNSTYGNDFFVFFSIFVFPLVWGGVFFSELALELGVLDTCVRACELGSWGAQCNLDLMMRPSLKMRKGAPSSYSLSSTIFWTQSVWIWNLHLSQPISSYGKVRAIFAKPPPSTGIGI